MYIVLVVLMVVVVVATLAVFAARNEWVYNARTSLLRSDYGSYCKLQSYDYMMNRLWIWDVSKFVSR